MRQILIDAPGAGDWIMRRAGGSFDLRGDHSFSTHRDGAILGGFVLADYLGNSWSVHMAGDDPHWCSRELLWLVFDYSFRQCGCHKMVTGVRSDKHSVLSMDLRAGWKLETVISDLFAPGVHMMVLTMTAAECRWLNYRPKHFRPNIRAPLEVADHG